MELTTRLAARLTHRLRVLRGTQESFTLSFGDVFVQAASYEGDAVLVEIGDEFLPADRQPTPAQHDARPRRSICRRPPPHLARAAWDLNRAEGARKASDIEIQRVYPE